MGGFRQASGRGEEGNDRRLHQGDRRPQEDSRRLRSLIAFGAILCAVGLSATLFVVGCEKQQKDPPAKKVVTAEREPAAAPRVIEKAQDIPECLRYQQLHYAIQQCEKLPQQARDALRQGFDAMSQSWSAVPSMPVEARVALAQACKQAGDALVQVGAATCFDNVRVEAPANAGGDQLPRSCNDYRGLIQRLQQCEKMPKQAREALEQGFEAMEQGWQNVAKMPREALEAMSQACKQGTEALRHAAAATCEW